ncbi:hypothetical protein BN182_3590018 [Clostridioides difficile E9]|nr:hypothetical protein BN182_3590018 [Clostridioides difficile E9]
MPHGGPPARAVSAAPHTNLGAGAYPRCRSPAPAPGRPAAHSGL